MGISLLSASGCGDLNSSRGRYYSSAQSQGGLGGVNSPSGYQCGDSVAPEILPQDEDFRNNPSYNPNNNDYLKYKICSSTSISSQILIQRMASPPSGVSNVIVIFPALLQNNSLYAQARISDGLPRAVTLDLGSSGSAVVSFPSDTAYSPSTLNINALIIAGWTTVEDQNNFFSLASCLQANQLSSCSLPLTKPFSYGVFR